MKLNFKVLVTSILLFSLSAFSEKNSHEHKHNEKMSEKESEKNGHGHDDGGAKVGPDKGITEKGPQGLRFSKEALATYEVTLIKPAAGIVKLRKQALVTVKELTTIFRVRDGWYKRIPVIIVSRDKELIVVKSTELLASDEVVSSPAGFLRIAEVITEEGASHSH